MRIAEIELEFGDGQFRFRLPPVFIDQIQKRRGYEVTWPDGAIGRRPKPIGMMMQEIMSGQFDALDCLEIIKQGLIAGGGGVVAGEDVELNPTKARMMMEDVTATWPLEEVHLFASAILRACWYGYESAEDKKSGNDEPSPTTADCSTSEQPQGL